MRVTMVQPLSPATPLVSAARQAAGAALRGYVPGAILARLDAGQTAWLSELRHVSVLFLGLPDLDDITPGALGQANDLVCEVQEALYEYEGSVNKLGVDDKGTTLVAAFGLPPVAHEDDGVRAVRAALGIQAQLRRHRVPYAIGIATGRAFCGSVGSDLRREYTMIGRVVNRGARLMQTALDDVICDRATHQAAGAKLAFERLAPRRVKGVAEPVAVFRPRGLRSSREAPGRSLVGRAQERRLLTGRLAALRAGHGGVLFIEGEAGIGKSRLVDELVIQAAGQPVRMLVGAADAIRTTTPYHAWRGVFEVLFDLTEVSEPSVRRARVLEWLRGRPDLERLAPLLGDVLPLDLPQDELIGELQGQVRADNIRSLLIGALQAASEQQPLLLVVEDAHWCDSASWALARLVAQQIPTALLVLALRPLTEPIPEDYQRLRKASGAQQLHLDPLPADDISALVGQRLGVTSVSQPVADLIGEHAGGNPFFSEEL
ncbi:MAG TPA: AAA family ATPase, partial [Actinomycetes bacterium]|nr:AAA family ATPase [Actinomycetes bacterium]